MPFFEKIIKDFPSIEITKVFFIKWNQIKLKGDYFNNLMRELLYKFKRDFSWKEKKKKSKEKKRKNKGR